MLGKNYERENCSAARALEVVGERWSLLIVRDALYAGSTRFTQFQRSLGIATNVLSARLEWFVDSGLMDEREIDGVNEYRLTSKGRDLEPVVLALSTWGDTWVAPDGPPIIYQHDRCGSQVHQYTWCETCRTSPPPGHVVVAIGPGMPTDG